MMLQFRNRAEAGEMLAGKLKKYAGHPGGLVLGLPRGGVPVGHSVARRLRLPLDVFIVRKLGVPGQEELAMGAIASGGGCAMKEALVAAPASPSWWLSCAQAGGGGRGGAGEGRFRRGGLWPNNRAVPGATPPPRGN